MNKLQAIFAPLMAKRYFQLKILCGVLFVVVLYLIWILLANLLDARRENRLLNKYKQDPQWTQVVQMLEKDRTDLANPNIEKGHLIGATMDMGFEWYVLREFDLAVKWWERGLDIEPNNVLGWYNLGNAYSELGKYSKAEGAYRESMTRARIGEVNACLALGEMYRYNYKRNKEESVYLECLKKHKDQRDIVAHLAGYYRDINDIKNAIIYFDKLFSLDPSPDIAEELRKLQIKSQQ